MAEHDQVPQDQGEEVSFEIIPDELPAEGGASGEAGGEGAPAPKVETAEEGLAELRAQLAERDREKEAAAARARDAEARADQAGREVQAGRTNIIDSRIGQVDGALETMKVKSAEARRAYADALREQDYDKVAEIQETIAENAVVTKQLQHNRAQLEQAKKQPAPQPRQPATDAERLEAFLGKMPAKPQAWLRARPEFLTDPDKNKRLVAAHANALIDHDEGSDGYFAAVEKQLGITPAAAEPAPRRAAAVAAPPSRGAPSLSRAPAAQTKVRLSATEVRMAQDMGLTTEEYARAKAKHLASKPAGATEH